MKKMMMLFLILMITLVTAIPSAAEEPEKATEPAALDLPEESGWKEIFSQLDGVISVEEIPLADSAQFFNEKYLVIFEQPLDWSDPDAGTFPQRVEIGLREEAWITALETNGYSLRDKYPGAEESPALFGIDDAPEVAMMTGANYVNVEHRFFGESRPEDMSNTDTRYWEYHTAENAANDYHRIYQALAPVLGDSWIATGTSRGGQMTNVYAYYFPEDMCVYVPYVAPWSEGGEDPRFYQFVFTEEQRAAFTYDDAFAKALAASVDTTTAKILMVFGATDPWYSLRMPVTDNPNVAVFVHPTDPHSAAISALPDEMRNEAISFMSSALG